MKTGIFLLWGLVLSNYAIRKPTIVYRNLAKAGSMCRVSKKNSIWDRDACLGCVSSTASAIHTNTGSWRRRHHCFIKQRPSWKTVLVRICYKLFQYPKIVRKDLHFLVHSLGSVFLGFLHHVLIFFLRFGTEKEKEKDDPVFFFEKQFSWIGRLLDRLIPHTSSKLEKAK